MKFENQTVVCIASGCSLNDEDLKIVNEAHKQNRCKVIVINNNYKRFPTADILYSADHTWWTFHKSDIFSSGFSGELWSQYGERLCKYDEMYKKNPELNFILCHRDEGLPKAKSYINFGGNSGFQAICLAYIFGANRIILLGYDMKNDSNGNSHWFGNHPDEIDKTKLMKYQNWINHMNLLANDAETTGLDILNCSRDTELTCFKKQHIDNIVWA